MIHYNLQNYYKRNVRVPRVNPHHFYNNTIEKYGDSAEGVHWNSTHSQEQRFKALRALLPTDLSDLTLVDVGCGFGHLYSYLVGNGLSIGRYLGLDIVPKMVTMARERTQCEILQLDVLVAESLPAADYYVCSGAMNTMTQEETYRFIERCYGACSCGFVFNLLRGADQSQIFNYCQPYAILEWCETLGAQTTFKDDYLYGDFTIRMLHP